MLSACPLSATPAPPAAFSNQFYPWSACLAATAFLQGPPSQQEPIWTGSSGQAEEVQDEGKAPEMPAPGAECSLWCQEVSLHLPQGWSEHGSARLGCTEGQRVPVPFSGPGITRKPPSCSTRSPARDFPLGLYVPCRGIRAGRAAGQRGEEMITATSYPCLPRAAGFISLIPIPAFSLLFSLEGRDHLLKAGAC